MDDTQWAVLMSDPDTAPDYFLDALKNARELGPKEFSEEVIATAAGMLVDSQGANPLVNALLLALQAFGDNIMIQLQNGPVTITFEVKADAETE